MYRDIVQTKDFAEWITISAFIFQVDLLKGLIIYIRLDVV